MDDLFRDWRKFGEKEKGRKRKERKEERNETKRNETRRSIRSIREQFIPTFFFFFFSSGDNALRRFSLSISDRVGDIYICIDIYIYIYIAVKDS